MSNFLLLFLVTQLSMYLCDPLVQLECDDEQVGYIVPDPIYCDRYLDCDPVEGRSIHLCPQGEAVHLESGFCEQEKDVDCSDRVLRWRADAGADRKSEIASKVLQLIGATQILSTAAPSELLSKGNLSDRRKRRNILDTSSRSSTLSNSMARLLSSSTEVPRTTSSNTNKIHTQSNDYEEGFDFLEDVLCEDDEEYVMPDPQYCDRYLACPDQRVLLCDGGMVLDVNTGFCTSQETTDCSARDKLFRDVGLEAQNIKNTNDLDAIISEVYSDGDDPLASIDLDAIISEVFTGDDDPLDSLVCEQSEEGYIVPDPKQCDRYVDCSAHGKKSYKLCPDGLVLSLEKVECDFPSKVDCADRPKLQTPLGKGQCPRENGVFPLSAEVSCSKYVDCRGGQGYVQSCGAHAVFDEVLGCVHPDETNRPGCTAFDLYQFQCPSFGLNQRFGDHDRLPHPTDCKLFYACLRNGLPRLLGCEKPTVFNPLTGLCDDHQNVPGCEGYYGREKVELDQKERERITEEVRQKLIKEFGLDRL